MTQQAAVETRAQILVVGAGQAGLALGFHLRRADARVVLVDAHPRVGDAWRRRWDSLTLFTPRRYDALPGLAFPGDPDGWPGKDEVADYLEGYAARFDLPVHAGRRVTCVRPRQSSGFTVDTTAGSYAADHVVVATGPFTTPAIPPVAADLSGDVVQLHSSQYRNPTQLTGSRVAVVGGGNTGVQIADELSRAGRQVTLSVSELGPAVPQRWLGRDVFWWFERLGSMRVRADSRMGRRIRSKNVIIGTDLGALLSRVTRAGRVVGAHDRSLHFADGASATFDAVLWATGFRASYPWLQVPVLDGRGAPVQRGGATGWPGLHFLGLPWQRNRGSALLGWVGEDAAILAERLLRPHQRRIPTRSATSV